MDSISISARGWDREHDPVVRQKLAEHNIRTLETAPGKIGADIGNPTNHEAAAYRQFWADAGIKIVAMQSLFFGHPTLSVFGTNYFVSQTVDHLVRMAEVAEILSARYLVLGAYQSRRRGNLNLADADAQFASFLAQILGRINGSHITILLEAVPAAYGADYLMTHNDIEQMVNLVNHPQVKMLLDLGAASTNNESESEVCRWARLAPHIHWAVPGFGRLDQSEQGLELFRSVWDKLRKVRDTTNGNRGEVAADLSLISIEMFEHSLLPEVPANLEQLIRWIKDTVA